MDLYTSFYRLSIALLVWVCMASCMEGSSNVPPVEMEEAVTTPQPKSMQTLTYAVKGKDTLELDLYLPEGWNQKKSPVLIFVHGGGFYTGTRKEENIHHFCDSLADNGIAAANISYRLYLKGQSFHCDQPSPEKIKAFQVAVNDIRSATRFLIDQSNVYNLDAKKIALCGSSAGGEAVLHAAFWANDTMNLNRQELDTNFHYAALASFAGALVDTALITPANKLPTLMYHGTCDPLVPYANAPHHFCDPSTPGALMLYGSKSIMERLDHLQGSYVLIATCGAGHGQASYPIQQDIPRVIGFFQDAFEGKVMRDFEVRKGKTNPCRYGGPYKECKD